MEHIAEHKPLFNLTIEKRPPTNTKMIVRTLEGVSVISHYDPEFNIIAWCPMPTFSEEQRARIEDYKRQGFDITRTYFEDVT